MDVLATEVALTEEAAAQKPAANLKNLKPDCLHPTPRVLPQSSKPIASCKMSCTLCMTSWGSCRFVVDLAEVMLTVEADAYFCLCKLLEDTSKTPLTWEPHFPLNK